MKEYRVRLWREDGSGDFLEFDSMEQAQVFYNSVSGQAEIQRYVEEIHDYEVVVYPTFEV